MSILCTGTAGFIGSNFLRILLNQTDKSVVSLDALTYAANLDNISDITTKQHTFFKGDICDIDTLRAIFKEHAIDTVFHFAAESHVDRSIMSSDPFVQTNIVGTQRLLDVSKEHEVKRFIHVSTDEVYGTLTNDEPPFTESHQIQPNSPYSASKAASDLLVRSYVETFGFPAIITRCSNNYGPYQFPEKLIPLMIHNAMNGKPLPVYGDGQNIRDWIHVTDHAEGILAVYEHGNIGEAYNIGGETELKNMQIVKEIIAQCNASEDLITFVKDRPGHDLRYAMDISKIKKECQWAPKISFQDGLKTTIQWYQDNAEWLARVMSGEYQNYYKEQYST